MEIENSTFVRSNERAGEPSRLNGAGRGGNASPSGKKEEHRRETAKTDERRPAGRGSRDGGTGARGGVRGEQREVGTRVAVAWECTWQCGMR